MKLYSYKLVTDNGSSPCIYSNLLSLNICKPQIRKNAKINDYIIGISSKSMNLDQKPKIIYIARITNVITMNNYYKKYPNRPDNIYNNKKLIKNIYHDCTNIKNDLSGINTILSNDFIYFGKNYINLPKKFYEIVRASTREVCRLRTCQSRRASLRSHMLTWPTSLKFHVPSTCDGSELITGPTCKNFIQLYGQARAMF